MPEIIDSKIHQKRKKKKWREHQIMLNSLFTALQGISGIPKNLVAKFWTKTEH